MDAYVTIYVNCERIKFSQFYFLTASINIMAIIAKVLLAKRIQHIAWHANVSHKSTRITKISSEIATENSKHTRNVWLMKSSWSKFLYMHRNDVMLSLIFLLKNSWKLGLIKHNLSEARYPSHFTCKIQFGFTC